VFLEHFQLSADPFGVAPDPAFLFLGPDHREALAALYYVMVQRRGCGLMAAASGMGKTLVLNSLRQRIGNTADGAFLSGPMNGEELLDAALMEFGISGTRPGAYWKLRALEHVLTGKASSGRRVVLAIDNADELSDDALVTLQTLCGLETGAAKLLDVLLSGHPSLVRRLSAPGLERLRQSIDVSCVIRPFDEELTAEYLYHRVTRAGANSNLFSDEASALLASATRGVPRRINQLAHQTLALAWSRGEQSVSEDTVWDVLRDLPLPELLASNRELAGTRQLMAASHV
jgi:type II secretory pathway predicted ATPase ExeA